jgi:hypothetical protein
MSNSDIQLDLCALVWAGWYASERGRHEEFGQAARALCAGECSFVLSAISSDMVIDFVSDIIQGLLQNERSSNNLPSHTRLLRRFDLSSLHQNSVSTAASLPRQVRRARRRRVSSTMSLCPRADVAVRWPRWRLVSWRYIVVLQQRMRLLAHMKTGSFVSLR